MENDKGQPVESNDETVTSTQEGLHESDTIKERVDINDINKRNAEEERQEKKSSYTLVGAIVLLIVLIIVAVYLFG